MSKIAAIHTSDRGNYKSCRRRWFWGSHIHLGLEPYYNASPLWLGSAVHFALENVHGSQHYPTSQEAFDDYTEASRKNAPKRLPPELSELVGLGRGMLDYYENQWLIQRDRLETYVLDGVPQVEVQFEVDLPIEQDFLDRAELDKVVYRGTMDRIAIDPFLGMLWIVEYKTAAQMKTMHYGNDPQVTAYCWAASCIYDIPCAGVIYQQHLKAVPDYPRALANGKISSDKKQNTTHRAYRKALIDMYGSDYSSTAPPANINCLNELAMMETSEYDPYVRRDRIYRNEQQIQSEGIKILLEVYEMLDPRTALYPHAGQHCGWCPFMSPCISVDDGSDWESELRDERLYVKRQTESNLWKFNPGTNRRPWQIVRQAVMPELQIEQLKLHLHRESQLQPHP